MRSQNQYQIDAMLLSADDFLRAGVGKIVEWIHLGLTGPFGQAPGTPRRTGEAAAGWGWGLNTDPNDRPTPGRPSYPPISINRVNTMMKSFVIRDEVRARNRVPRSVILAGGRRFSENANRMLGSQQAPGQPPQDFVTLALREAQVRAQFWRYEG